MTTRWSSRLGLVAAALALAACVTPADACIRVSYSIGRIINESAHVSVYRITAVNPGANLVTYTKVRDLKGKHPEDTIVMGVGYNGEFTLNGQGPGFCGKEARDYRDIMELSRVGKEVVWFMSPNGYQSEVCLGDYWYQTWKGGNTGGTWYMFHSEPTFTLAFAGRPANLAKAVESMLAGQEVVVPCFRQSDTGWFPLLSRTAKQQRMRASLKLQDYNVQRDFVSWGGDSADLRVLTGMPGFLQYGELAVMGPGPVGVAAADFTGDGKTDLCLYSRQNIRLMEFKEGGFTDSSMASIDKGAHAAAWADYNGDGKSDLLLATPGGLRLFTNTGSNLVETTAGLPRSPYPHFTAAAWVCSGKDAKPDIVAADGFRGLQFYRNKWSPAEAASKPAAPKTGKWYYTGPFDNAGGTGFAAVYPPEKGVDLAATYTGKAGLKVGWKEGNFTDGQVNDLLPLFQAPHNENSVVYLYREFELGSSMDIPVSLGSDDTLTVWFNGEQVSAENVSRACAPDQTFLTFKAKRGRNTVLLKIGQGSGNFAFYFSSATPIVSDSGSTSFEDVSATVGLGSGGLAADIKGDHLAVADVNGDGRQDILFSAGTGVLLLNTPEGFKAAPQSGIQYQAGGVAPAFGDFNGDGKPDLFVPQRQGLSRLFVNEGAGRFRDVTAKSGALADPIGQATCAVWSDFCGSGKQDLLIGCVYGPNRYLRNRGNGTFADASGAIGLDQNVYSTFGLCTVDMNNDGVLDLIMSNSGTESAFLIGSRNRMTGANGTATR